MKKTIIAAIGLMAFQQNTAVAQAFKKGDKIVNTGLGLGAYTVKEGLFSYYTAHSGIGLGASGEYGLTDDISVGVSFGFSRYSQTATKYNEGISINFLHFGGRASYHFGNILKLPNDKIDLYAGAGLGLRFFTLAIPGVVGIELQKAKDELKKYADINTLFIPVHVGSRYYFKDNMAAFAELSTGFSIFQGGIGFKF
jgi:hypothetical protein